MERKLLTSVAILNSYKEEHDLSNAQLAKQLKVSQSTISDWLSGSKLPSGEHVEAILHFLKLIPEDNESSDPFSHPEFAFLEPWQLKILKDLLRGFREKGGDDTPPEQRG